MKLTLLILFIGLFISGCHQNISATNLKPDLPQLDDQSDIELNGVDNSINLIDYSSFEKGDKFFSGREQYTILPELFSVIQRSGGNKNENNSLTQNLSASSNFLKKKGNFAIYKSAKNGGVTSLTSQSVITKHQYPVVLNSRTNNLGIVTGKIKVKLDNYDDLLNIAADFNLKIADSFRHLNLVFFEVKNDQDIIQQGLDLASDTRIKSANIEVLEHILEAH